MGDKDIKWLWEPVTPVVYHGDGGQKVSVPGSLAVGEELLTGDLGGKRRLS